MEEDRMLTDEELAEFSTKISEIKQMVVGHLTESNRRHEEFMAQIRNMLLNPSQINPPPAFEPLSSLVNPDSVETDEIKTNDVDTAVSTEEEALEEKEELQTLGNVSNVQIESTDSQFPQDEANVTGNQFNIPLLVIWSDYEYMDPYLHPAIDGLKILDIICTPTVCRNASMDLSLHYASLSLKCSQYNLIIFMPWRIMNIDLDKPPPLPPETMQGECYSSMQCIKSRGSRNGWKIDVKCELMRLEPTIRRMGCLKDMLMAEDMSHCRHFEWVPKVMDSYIYSIDFNVNSGRLVCGGLICLALKDGADFISFGGNLQHGSKAGGNFVGLIGHLFLMEHVLKINTHYSSTDFSEYSSECLGLDYSNCSQVFTSVDALVMDSSNGKRYLKAKDVEVDGVLLYENTNSDMNKQHYLTLRTYGLIGLTFIFSWQLYTLWVLVQLHESTETGKRCSRYFQLSEVAFGNRLGKLLALIPIFNLSAGTCIALVIIGGSTSKQLFSIICGEACKVKPLTPVEWYLVFTTGAVMLSQLPNMKSIAGVSLIGAVTAVGYCMIIWVVSAVKGEIRLSVPFTLLDLDTAHHDRFHLTAAYDFKRGDLDSTLEAFIYFLTWVCVGFSSKRLIFRTNGFTVFSSPRPPKFLVYQLNLEDKVIFKGDGMLHERLVCYLIK